MKKIFFLLILVPTCNLLLAQKSIIKSYSNYFENTREVPFLHLNKTTFFVGEEIWFKAYVQEQNSQKLHKTTSNLYISIFDQKGNIKDQKLIKITEGIGRGNIKIDSTYTKESYYLKASTSWMKNFHEDNSYIQEISIITNEKQQTDNSINQEEFYEFKLFPEGGHIVSETINNLGVLIKNKNNEGIHISKGVVKNSKGVVIKEFTTNKFGLGSVNLFFDKNEIYTLEATLDNGILITQKTSIPKEIGITMRVINSNTKKLFIKFSTNEKSLPNLNTKTYTVFIHNTRNYQKQELTFQNNNTNYSIIINKENLIAGVNIITVFNENFEPILERIIYNHKKELYADIGITKINSTNDSLTFQIKNKSNQKLYLSSSFLPFHTKAYKPTDNIYNAFIFKPYIKGHIQDAEYYLSNINHKKLRDLDLLLLTQGWSKYDWSNIFNNHPKTYYEFENGITITGKLNKPLKSDQELLIFSGENNIVQVLKPNNGNFKLPNTFVHEDSHIQFGIKGKEKIIHKITPSLQFSKRSSYEILPNNYTDKIQNKKQLNFKIENLASTFKETEILDEVRIRKKRNIEEYENPPYGAVTFLSRQKMKNYIFSSSETVIDFLKGKLYNIYMDDGEVIINPRSGCTLKTNNYKFRPLVRLFLDNNEISQMLWITETLYLDRVKEIYYGRVFDNNSCEHVYIYSYSPAEYKNKKSTFSYYRVSKGFSKAKEYYTPTYNSYIDYKYVYFGDVFWKPDIEIKPNSYFQFKVPLNLQEKIIIYTEGISESGQLISKKHVLSKKTNQ
ncbi:hypothetical protein P8625_08245 [Tenacibaculum tangerinum]|uniref:Macroglobulin domain-containing protein n=1 Tax=Tenacibaculum tangerinum TaxID=3038772 RepID=A0ABY8KXY3_9FLAO|nr:hypothetical protein [Tenacibaculum tangerinum]WGH74111.1 hypothetical protein P8625_08245 [Tenacibaculum tangerinum]